MTVILKNYIKLIFNHLIFYFFNFLLILNPKLITTALIYSTAKSISYIKYQQILSKNELISIYFMLKHEVDIFNGSFQKWEFISNNFQSKFSTNCYIFTSFHYSSTHLGLNFFNKKDVKYKVLLASYDSRVANMHKFKNLFFKLIIFKRLQKLSTLTNNNLIFSSVNTLNKIKFYLKTHSVIIYSDPEFYSNPVTYYSKFFNKDLKFAPGIGLAAIKSNKPIIPFISQYKLCKNNLISIEFCDPIKTQNLELDAIIEMSIKSIENKIKNQIHHWHYYTNVLHNLPRR